jgi:hypothetical protein
MPIQSPGLKLDIAELSGRLLEELEVLPLAKIVAKTEADALPADGIAGDVSDNGEPKP